MTRGRPRKYKTKKDAAVAKASCTKRSLILCSIDVRSHDRKGLQTFCIKSLEALMDELHAEQRDAGKQFSPRRPDAQSLPEIPSVAWFSHSMEQDISQREEDRWDMLQKKMNDYRAIIREAVLDAMYFEKRLQHQAHRFCSKHLAGSWPLAHQCGFL